MARQGGLTICTIAALALLTSGAVRLAAKEGHPAPNPLTEIVAVGRAPGRIALATPALPLAANRWRFRIIRLEPETEKAQAVVLSRSGTKILIVFADGSASILDLTQRITTIGAGQINQAQHRLPGQLFPVARAGRICLVDDSGQQQGGVCKTAAAAAIGEGGRALFAGQDGSLFIAPVHAADSAAADDSFLPYHVQPGARYELLAGHNGDQREFLVLTQQEGKVRIVDPTGDGAAQEGLGAYDGWEAAALRAMLDFNLPARLAASQTSPSDATLRALAANLVEQSKPASYEWSFFRVRPELALYSPVLEFAPGEPDYPSDFAIWDRLRPISKGTSREEYHAAYDTMGAERFHHCTVYYRVSSYPGSWLLEYWYYYPFDEGKPHPHIHDSEHIFIEVDKLGGAVRSVLASAHDNLVPNNNYSTFVPGAQPVALPLYAFVELGKHAMSPDINRDGKFTRGVDVNLYSDRYEVWGVRDLGAKKGKMMEFYRPYMTLPRKEEDRFASQDAAQFFTGLEVHPEKETCGLVPFPEDPPCKSCAPGTAESARTHLVSHTDAQHPEGIYKPWVLPWQEVRFGLGLFEHGGNPVQLYVAYVTNPHHWTGGRFPFPGRLSLESMFTPTSQVFLSPSGSQTIATRLSRTTEFGARFERFLTNTQGFYGGFSAILRRATSQIVGGPVVSGPHWIYEGIWYRLGYLLELPTRRKGNLTQHWGVAFHGTTFRFEWRVSVGVLRRHGRDSFGIRPDEPSPYQ